LRILLTVHQFVPEYFAGTEVLTFETAKELRRLGHEVSVFTGSPASKPMADQERFDSYVYQGIHVERFHHDFVALGDQTNVQEAEYRNLFLGEHFRAFVMRTKPDIVHFFHLARLSASVVEICWRLNIPMVMTPTDFWFVCPTVLLWLPNHSMCPGPRWGGANCLRHIAELHHPELLKAMVKRSSTWRVALKMLGVRHGLFKNQWYVPTVRAFSQRHPYLREQINRMDQVMVPTRLMGKILKRHGLKQQKIRYAPYGMNLENLQRTGHREASDSLRVGYIGTLWEHKGAHILIKAMTSLDSSVKIELKIYGDQEQYPDYVKRIKELAGTDSRIRFCGTFPNQEIAGVFSSLDVLVVPSLWYENTPLVIYTAQALGCPVIVSDLDGMTEAIHHGENGLIFQPGNASELAQAMLKLYKNRNLLEEMSRRARMPTSKQEYALQIESAYREILASRKKQELMLA
jgi:glycosyltransferase involved in cell wall biosynthesis